MNIARGPDSDPTPDDIELLQAINESMSGLVVGIDIASHPSYTVYRCSCGVETSTLDRLMRHIIDEHQVFTK